MHTCSWVCLSRGEHCWGFKRGNVSISPITPSPSIPTIPHWTRDFPFLILLRIYEMPSYGLWKCCWGCCLCVYQFFPLWLVILTPQNMNVDTTEQLKKKHGWFLKRRRRRRRKKKNQFEYIAARWQNRFNVWVWVSAHECMRRRRRRRRRRRSSSSRRRRRRRRHCRNKPVLVRVKTIVSSNKPSCSEHWKRFHSMQKRGTLQRIQKRKKKMRTRVPLRNDVVST